MGLKSTTDCLGYQQITSLSSSTALTVPTGATMALIVPENQSVRWRDDGTAPTAGVGMLLPVNSTLNYDGNLQNLRFIEILASAKLNISYYR
jgi:predicted hotdog family 3-hydroxylacyl-ACP dehydratase